MRILLLIAVGFFLIPDLQAQTINLGSTTVQGSTLYTTTDLPWELKYGPGDSLWMTTRQGKVIRVHPLNGGATILLDHGANVWQSGEAGMLGMTFHPNFSITPHVFIAYTYTVPFTTSRRERLSRFTLSGNALIDEFIVIDGGNIVANTTHNGSRLVILPDNTLLMTTGDAANTATAQDNNSLNGKILRVNLDGTIPANNPNPASLIYSKGHRNPQGLVLHPNGKVYETEHGPGNNDEFQIIEANRNYGWPTVHGFCDNDINGAEIAFCNSNNVKEPLISWLPSPGSTWAPSDLVWYASPSMPEFQNSFLVTFLKTMKITRVILNAAGTSILDQDDFFVNTWGRLRDITVAPNGDLFIATNTSPNRIIRVTNPSAAPLPVSLINFSATSRSKQALITWKTSLEQNLSHFDIERSENGTDFYKIGQVNALNISTGSTYQFTDVVPANGKNYYRLKMIDADGKFQYSEIDQLSFQLAALIISPNPATSNITYTLNELVSGSVSITVFDMQGRTVMTDNKFVNNTTLSGKLAAGKLQRGTYVIKIIANNQTYQSFFEKQ